MMIKNIKFRHITIGVQFLAGITLLTASYLTTESGWSNDLVNAVVHSDQAVKNKEIRTVKVVERC